jgi:predicted DNA-binding transcriptional regulator AlpA
MPEDLLTLKEVSKLLGVREGTLRMWRMRSYGPESFKVGVAVVYHRDVIEKWMADQADATGKSA